MVGLTITRRFLLPAAMLATMALPVVAAGADVPRPAPEFAVRMPDGSDMLLSQQRGKVVCLMFILTTCPHCQKLVGTMSRLQPQLGSQGLVTIAAAIQDMASLYVAGFYSRFQAAISSWLRGPRPCDAVHAARSEIPFLQSQHEPDRSEGSDSRPVHGCGGGFQRRSGS